MLLRFLAFTLILVACVPATASELKTADCAAIAGWSADFAMQPTQAVAPTVTLPAAVADEQIVPLFGKPITGWSRKDFAEVNKQMNSCQRGLFKSDRATAQQINAVRKQFKGIARSVGNLSKAVQQADRAAEQLLTLPGSAETRQALDVAIAALNGGDVTSRVRSLPRAAQRPMTQLQRAYANLATTAADALQQRLQARSDAIEAAQQAQAAAAAAAEQEERERLAAEKAQAEQQAAAELQTARSELDALPAASGNLAELDRLAALPALNAAPADDAAAFRQALAAKRQAIDGIVQRERAARIQDELGERLAQLRDFEIGALSDLGTYWQMRVEFTRLASDPANAQALAATDYQESERRTFGERFEKAAAALLPSFTERLAAIPETQAGMQQLRTSVVDITGVQGTPIAMQPYVAAARERAKAINARLRHAAEWLPIAPRLTALLQGDDVDEASIRGLSPGMPHTEAVALARRQWGFEPVPDLSLETSYGLSRQAQRQLEPERRDGGTLKLKKAGDRVGQITFTEYYKAKIELDALRDALTERFGKPDSSTPSPGGLAISWRDGSQRLQVRAINQVDVMRRNVGFRSQLGLALWNDDYEDYAEEANERCDRIRKTPRSQMSIEDSVFFTTNCAISGPSVRPGL